MVFDLDQRADRLFLGCQAHQFVQIDAIFVQPGHGTLGQQAYSELEDIARNPYRRFGRVRIALAFPDVGMGQFMRISSLPGTINNTMSEVAGAEKKATESSW